MENKNILYIFLVCFFCNIFVVGNLIFHKFVSIEFLNISLNVSVGILLFPVTFIISDLITEFYGKKQARMMVNISIILAMLTMFVIYIADSLNATSWSRVDNETFTLVFGSYGIAAMASLFAGYISQNCDIFLYDWVKILTKGNYLWLRSNLSTLIAQIVDTLCVATILLMFDIIPESQYFVITSSSLQFKIIATILSTPFCYLGYKIIQRIK
jgi:uncharacterized integral membrane protein (TIGR00697 family)